MTYDVAIFHILLRTKKKILVLGHQLSDKAPRGLNSVQSGSENTECGGVHGF